MMKTLRVLMAAAGIPAACCAAEGDSLLPAAKVSSAVVADGRLDEPVWSEAEWSRPFALPDRETAVNGVFERAPAKFVENAATMAAAFDRDALYVAVKAPFPSDVKPAACKTGGYCDPVSLFLCPVSGYVFQLVFKPDGTLEKFKYTEEMPSRRDWTPEGIAAAATSGENVYTVEFKIPFVAFGVTVPSPGRAWRMNALRTGKSCGGRSDWCSVGGRYYSPALYGQLVFGSWADRRRAENARKEALKKLNGDVNIAFWQYDSWESYPATIMPDEGTPAFGRLRLASPRGARAIGNFLVSNLSETPALYDVAVESADEAFARIVRIRRAQFVESKANRIEPDAIFPLPLGSSLRVDGGSTVPVWVDVPCTNLTPGVHRATLRFTPAYAGFAPRELALELFVGRADVAEVVHPTWTYTVRWPQDIRLLSRDYGFNTADILPFMYMGYTKDRENDYHILDDVIRAFNESGVPTDRINFLLYGELPRWGNFTTNDGRKYVYLTPEWKAEYGRRLKNFIAYVKKTYGIGYDRLAFYTNDEPAGDPDVPKTGAWHAMQGAAFIHSVDPKLRTFCDPWKCEPEYAQRYLDNFDVLEPCLPRLKEQPKALELFRAAAAKGTTQFASYGVCPRECTADGYRLMHWENLQLGFGLWAAFYDLWDAKGDMFNGRDGGTCDYNAAYRNRRVERLAPSRRLEAWYLGLVDAKLVKWCRAHAKTLSAETAKGFEAELDALVAASAARGANLAALSARLLKLSERIADAGGICK